MLLNAYRQYSYQNRAETWLPSPLPEMHQSFERAFWLAIQLEEFEDYSSMGSRTTFLDD